MKRLIAVLTGLVMLCGIAAACAEETLPYLETQNQDVYINSTILTEASYPQVCISPYSAYSIIESSYKEPWFVTFPGPAGASCSEFYVDSCQYFDLENYRQYFYQATDSYSYETFLNKCSDESNIVLDGSDKIAAYIKPDNGSAYGLLGLDEIERGAKLYVQIRLDTIRKVAEEERADLLKGIITEEVNRIRDSMACTKLDQYWTIGAFRGVKLFSYSIPGMTVTQDLPEINFHFDGQDFGGKMFITSVDGEQYNAYVVKDSELAVTIKAEINSYSYVFYNREESEYTMATLVDGSEWGIYVSNEKDGKPYSVYASRVLSSKDKYGNDNPTYFTFQVSASSGRMVWADVDAFKADLNTLVQSVTFTGLPESTEAE